ncbi:MAG: hypothetical protein SGBAC_013377, partial [Bacillariaceae sp.]
MKRRRVENPAVMIYNLRASADLQRFSAFVEQTLEEMSSETVEVVNCRAMNSSANIHAVMVTFKTSEHSDLAISLCGVEYMNQALYVRTFEGLGKRKQHLCISHLYASCYRQNFCFNAHGVAELKLYPDTVLHENRARYIHYLKGVKQGPALIQLRQRLRKKGVNDFVTAFYYREDKKDAIIEFASAKTARKASEVFRFVRPWKPQYQSVFLDSYDKVAEARKKISALNDHAIYVSGITRNVLAPETLVSWIPKKEKIRCGKKMRVTKMHFRKETGDALVEFANPSQAATARSVLNGLVTQQLKLSAQPWTPEHQNMFFPENQKQAGTQVQKESIDALTDPTEDCDSRRREQPTQDSKEEGTVDGDVDMNAPDVNQSNVIKDETEGLHRRSKRETNSGNLVDADLPEARIVPDTDAIVKQQNNAGDLAETRNVSLDESWQTMPSTGVSDDGLNTRLAEANSQIELLSSLLDRTKEKL